MSSYVFDKKAELEELRLRALEAWCDPITTEHLTKLGVAPGWRCLELGAGRGSIASWLADRVGEGGRVVAIDLDLTLLEQHRRPNLGSGASTCWRLLSRSASSTSCTRATSSATSARAGSLLPSARRGWWRWRARPARRSSVGPRARR